MRLVLRRAPKRLPPNADSHLKMTIDGQSREATVTGKGQVIKADFGEFTIERAGYHRIALESLNDAGNPFGDLELLVLNGAVLNKAHFNLKERRNAAAVHVVYPVPKETEIEAF